MKYYYFFIAVSLFSGNTSFEAAVEVGLSPGKLCLIVDALAPIDNKLESGQEATISILEADGTIYTYGNQIIEQIEGSQGPFQDPIAAVKCEFFDITDLETQEFFNNVKQAVIFPFDDLPIVQEFKSTITFRKLI